MNLSKCTKQIGFILLCLFSTISFSETKSEETINYFITDTLYVSSTGTVPYVSNDYLDDFQNQNSSITEIISSSSVSTSCESVGIQVVDFVVSDGILFLDASLTLTILDTINPVVSLQPIINMNLGMDGMINVTMASLNINSHDNCSYEAELNPSTFSCSEVGLQTVIVTLTDPSGNIQIDSTQVNVVDNTSPTIEVNQVVAYLDSSGNASISVGQFDNGSFDNCDESFVFTISDSIFSLDDLGMNDVVFTVTNSHLETTSLNTQVEVKDTTPPTLLSMNIEMYLDAEGEITIAPSAYDNGTVDNSIIYNLSTNKDHFTCDDLGLNDVLLTATDNYDNSVTVSVQVDIIDNIAPVAIAHDVTLVLDEAGNAILTPESLNNGSTDNCHVNLSVSVSEFDCTDLGSNNVFLTVTDNDDNSNFASSVVTVVDNSAPIAEAQTVTLFLNQNGVVSLDPEDLDNGSNDNCSEIVEYSSSKTLFECSDLGTNIVLFSIEDEHENTSSINVPVIIEDNLPPVVILQDIVVSLDTNGEFLITALEVDGGSYDNCSSPLIFSFSDTILTTTDLGDNIINVIVSDSNGNSSDGDDVVITVNDNHPPVLTSPISDKIVYSESNICGKFVFFDLPIITDNSGTYTTSYSQGSGSFFALGETQVVFTATDPSNNITTDTFMVMVLDNTPPEVLSSISNYTFDSYGVVTWDEAQLVFSDNCSSNLNYSLSHHSLDTFSVGDTYVTGTVTDESNNTTPFTFIITVEDIVDPEFDDIPNDFNVYLTGNASCEAEVNYEPAQASDDYSNVTITYSIESGTMLSVGIHNILITAADSSGNSIEETIQVEVIDTISPNFNSFPSDMLVGFCDNLIEFDLPEVSDNCGIHSMVRISGLPSGSNFPVGQHTVVYRITDVNGNIKDSSFVVEVVQGTPPLISTVKVGCTDNEPFALATNITNIEFFGTGVQGQMYDPTLSGEGIHNVEWVWTDENNCEHEGNMEIIINKAPPMPVIIQTNILQLSVHNAYNSYQWYRNGVLLEAETNISMNFTMGGNYEVIVGNESDCFVLSKIFKIGIGVYPSLSIEEIKEEEIVLSPNPATEELIISSYLELVDYQVEVINVLGQSQILTNIVRLNSNQIRIDISELPNGIYTINLRSERGLLSKKMIVK